MVTFSGKHLFERILDNALNAFFRLFHSDKYFMQNQSWYSKLSGIYQNHK